jgi:UDP-N-acetylmuramate dehydrogenase
MLSLELIHPDIEILKSTDLGKFSTFKLKKDGNVIIANSVDGLKVLGSYLKDNNFKFEFVGLGANQILNKTDENFVYVRVNLPNSNDKLKYLKNEYELSASTTLNHLTTAAMKFGLSGWEVFTGVPATLGGAIVMNAGTGLGEIGSVVKEVRILRNFKDIVDIKINDSSFKYRGNNFVEKDDIILSAVLTHKGIDETVSQKIKDYLNYRKNSQPLSTKNCGCVFKNYNPNIRAGLSIDKLGLKGLTNGGLRVSNIHANFFENFNDASFDQFTELKSLIDDYSDRFLGLKFELEVKI